MTGVNAFLSRWQAQEIAIFGHLNLALENFCRNCPASAGVLFTAQPHCAATSIARLGGCVSKRHRRSFQGQDSSGQRWRFLELASGKEKH